MATFGRAFFNGKTGLDNQAHTTSPSASRAVRRRCRDHGLKRRETLLEFYQLVFWQVAGAAGRHTPRSLEKSRAHGSMLSSARDIVESAQQPQAHRYVSNRIVPDLLKRRIEQAVEGYPRHEQPHYVRRRVIVKRWRYTAYPEDHDPTELIHAADGSAWVVDRGRYRAQRNVDDLDDAKLNVLLHGARRPDVEGGDQVERAVGRNALRLRHSHERNAGRHKLTDAALQMHANLVGFRKDNKAIDIDIADIAGLPIEDGRPVLCRRHFAAIRKLERTPWIGHELVDDQLGFARNSIHNVIDADREGDG